ncbi:hypothetical protein [Clostridium manihotivorum]|uniref:Uncharacterized protein n=1 Tax=Clostridium manihotivorum TaxID=2320868 RepID=A0A410DY54_9CLOT|nr:hypothetical protein [Clostridium manihotivorum]QAA34015.1 hypothetical protein C1I91_21640 [Clostridium manihotivorum]
MSIKLSDDDFKLIDAVLEDYKENSQTNKVCLHCGKPMKLIQYDNSYEVRCDTDNCVLEYFQGI